MPAPETKSDDVELRSQAQPVELRSVEGGTSERVATGYAVLFNSEANIYDMWTEVFLPGAFDKSLQERDVIAIHSHDNGRILGRKNAGTLTLRSDAKGLHFENSLPDTSDGRDLAVQIGRGDVAGMSFGFRALVQEWDDSVDPPKRTVKEAELYEITYTAAPAYRETEVGLRSLEHAKAERRQHNKDGASSRIARRMRLQQAERRA